MLFAEDWVDLEDVQPEDLVFQIVRQLIADLNNAGFKVAEKRFSEFFQQFRSAVSQASLTGVELGTDPLKVSFTLKALPTARRDLRKLLQGQLLTIYDLVNTEVLGKASQWLAKGGYQRILIIVDQLDRIPQKLLNGVTNHENLFFDHAGTLRALRCDVLYTVPIELAYSRCRNRLKDHYG